MALDFAVKHKRNTLSEKIAFGIRETILGLFSANLATLAVLVIKGPRTAAQLASHNYKLYSGFGLHERSLNSPWRTNCTLPCVPPGEIFEGIDFTRGPELLFPAWIDLGITTLELSILCQLVRGTKPLRVIEFGTAHGRTAANLAAYLPQSGELITVDLPCGERFLYIGQSGSERIKQIECDLTKYDWSPYKDSAQIVFCDACDMPEPFTKETALAFDLVTNDGIILWHDYGFNRYRTWALNRLGEQLPLRNIEGTNFACLRTTPQVKNTAQKIYAATQAS
jgi:methyltransferase family protein